MYFPLKSFYSFIYFAIVLVFLFPYLEFFKKTGYAVT